MASSYKDFSVSGPAANSIPTNWWENPDHKRSVVACLVNGVYVMESNRKNKRNGAADARSLMWWKSFGFQCCRPIYDKDNAYIIGAIYRHTSLPSPCDDANAPAYVVAYRGTRPYLKDSLDDARLILNTLHTSSRSSHALDDFLGFYDKVKPSNVWLAGHSLGAAVALVVGKHMVRELNVCLDCFLFNPPFIAPPIGLLKCKTILNPVRVVDNVVVASVARALDQRDVNDSFLKLCPWHPHLFVHRKDGISVGYIGYFAHRDKMERYGLGRIGRLATGNTVWHLIQKHVNGNPDEVEPVHQFPSANLTVNRRYVVKPHALCQWWRSREHLELKTTVYRMESARKRKIQSTFDNLNN